MPVINLPKDTRWGDLGEGLGKLIGGIGEAIGKKQMANDVATTMSDPSVSQDKMPIEVLKKHGDAGYQMYKEMLKSQMLQTEMQQHLANIGLTTVNTKLKEAQLPYAQQKEATDIDLAKARTAATQAEVPLRGAQTGEANVRAQELGEQSRKVGTEADILAVRRSQLEKAAEGGTTTDSDAMLAPFASSLGGKDSTQYQQWKASLDQTYKGAELKTPGSGQAAAAAQLRTLTGTLQKAETVKPLDQSERKLAGQAAEYATTIKTFTETLRDNPDEVGLLTGAPLRGWLERHGVATGDSALLNLLETQKQAVGQQARGGSVFMSGQTIRLASDIAPSVNRSPMANVIAVNTIADQKLAELNNNLLAYEGTAVQTKPIKDAISRWQEIKDITGTFKTQIVPDPRRPNDPSACRTVAYFAGAQVDPLNFKPLVKNDDTKYTLRMSEKGAQDIGKPELAGKEVVVRGDYLFASGEKRKKDPDSLRREWGGR